MKEDEFDDLPDYDSLFRDDDVSSITWNYIAGVLVSVLALSLIDSGVPDPVGENSLPSHLSEIRFKSTESAVVEW